MKNQNLPPVGTKVYHIQYGWGEVISVKTLVNTYPVEVRFGNSHQLFTELGCVSKSDKHPTLSLTEYDLVKGGFTPISDWNKPKVGDVGYFWDNEDDELYYGAITSIGEDGAFPYKTNGSTIFVFFSPTIPEWYTDKLNEIKSKL